jgi:hypothetical protein
MSGAVLSINSYLEYYYSCTIVVPCVKFNNICSRILLFKSMHFRYYILGLLTTFAFSLKLDNKPDSFDLLNGRSLEDWDLEDVWDDSAEER